MDNEKLRGFVAHGVKIKGERGDQVYGECPFCGGIDKFHINQTNSLWDCKKCGKSGNFTSFLEQTVTHNKKLVSENDLKRLSVDRGLPLKAFEGWEMGHNGHSYTFPVRDIEGRIVDVRMFRLGKKLMGTATCSTGLHGLHRLKDTKREVPVYLCEGEWDGIALNWLLRFLKQPGVVVSVPGASVFKKEWCHHFEGRTVHALYDNDEAGENGELLLESRIAGTPKNLTFIRWSDKLPPGYDIRDLIALEAIKKKEPRQAFKALSEMRILSPRKTQIKTDPLGHEMTVEMVEKIQAHKLQDVYDVIHKWLYLKNNNAIDVALATVLSNRLEGDPLWMFLVAPPGGAKTEILNTLSTFDDVYMTSSLTSHSLISGASGVGHSDPSLIPKLNGKVLLLKDFTCILSKKDQEQEEIFGILRDAFDGTCSKVFGNGIKRTYQSRFTILSAVTPKIYELGAEHQSLGERFLKFSIESNLSHSMEEDIIHRAIGNLTKEVGMRNEMCEVVRGFLHHRCNSIKDNPMPIMPPAIQNALVSLSQWGARMRGTVAREKYRPEMISSRPSAEVGSRLGKQLAKFTLALTIVRSKKVVTWEEYEMAKKVMMDTVSQRNEDVIREIVSATSSGSATVKTSEISARTRYTHSTIARLMADMNMLDIVKRHGTVNKYEWQLSPYMMDLVVKAKLYNTIKPTDQVAAEKFRRSL
jgi:hypothetical protein